LRIPLDRERDIPLYQQIKNHFREGILSGSLAPDTRLPASRKLAQDLGVNRITVETAYSELEADGLIYSRVGSGTYVLHPQTLPLLRPKENREAAWPLWQQNMETGSIFETEVENDKLLRAALQPDPIRFSGGSSAPRMFPTDDFRKVLQTVMRRDGMTALDYGESNG